MLQDPSPLESRLLADAAGVLDLVYPDPPLVRAARIAGIRAADGIGMLVAQGALSFRLWTEVSPDRDVMRRAVLAAVRRRE